MKHFPFRILFISIFLPPVLYIFTLQMLEIYFQKRETSKLNGLIIQDYDALYEGRYGLKEEINRNLGKYFEQCGLSSPISTNNAHYLSLVYLKGHIL